MSVFTIPRKRFDWERFVGNISRFALSRGSDEPFLIVEDGKVVFAADHEELTLADGMKPEDVPADPTERLEAGFALYAPFALFHDFGELACADGGTVEVPDLDELDDESEDEDERPPITKAQRRLIEKTECDECRAYGFQISLNGTDLVLQTVRMSESDGDCEVDAVAEAGLVDQPMAKFINSFVSKRDKKHAARRQNKPPTATTKNDETLMIRYMGADHARRFVIQRGDGKFWMGDKWSKILDNAKVFTSHRAAGAACNALHRRKWGGKPCRTFKVAVEVTLVADNVERIDPKTLARFLADAVRLDVESSIHGEGPEDDSFVTARLDLSTLEETPSPKKVF